MLRLTLSAVAATLIAGGALAQQPPVKPAAPPAAAVQKAPAQPIPQGQGILPDKLNPSQKEVLQAISKYFGTIRTLQGEFVQFAQNGSRSEGTFYLTKPGKIRFQYSKPSTLDVVADGVDVIVRDRKRQTQDLYPLSKTPLRFLLADQLDLSAEASVTKVSVDADLVTVLLEQSTVFGDGSLALVFDRKSADLLQWTVKDAQGYTTDVTIYNTVMNQPIDDKNYYIDKLFNQMNKPTDSRN